MIWYVSIYNNDYCILRFDSIFCLLPLQAAKKCRFLTKKQEKLSKERQKLIDIKEALIQRYLYLKGKSKMFCILDSCWVVHRIIEKGASLRHFHLQAFQVHMHKHQHWQVIFEGEVLICYLHLICVPQSIFSTVRKTCSFSVCDFGVQVIHWNSLICSVGFEKFYICIVMTYSSILPKFGQKVVLHIS